MDKMLSDNFSFYQLTRTDHADLQDENRSTVTEEELGKLTMLAQLLELVRSILSQELDIHSGRRFLKLNKRVGGSERSQHLKSEAVDFSPRGPDTEESIDIAFGVLIDAAKKGILKFGQLIVESEGKSREGRKYWIHLSLGFPFRDPARCGEIARMVDGKFETIAKV